MNTLDLDQLENISGGTVGEVINGVCVAVTAAGMLGWIALATNPYGQALAAGCLVNAVGTGAGWW